MDKEKKISKKAPRKASKNIVQEIFGRRKASTQRVSTIFTHNKSSTKIMPSSEKNKDIPADITALPAVVDIGASSVKILRLGENEKHLFEIICVDEEPRGKSLAGALDNLKARNNIGSSCVFTVPAGDTQVYNLDFPPMTDVELESAVRYKITQLKPFGLGREDLVCKWKALSMAEGGRSPERKIIAVCAPKDVILKRADALKKSGFTPVRAEAPQFSLANLGKFRNVPRGHENEVTLWAHIGAEESFLAVENRGGVCFTRKIALTSGKITEAISAQCGVSTEEAEKLKKSRGFILRPGKPDAASGDPAATEQALNRALTSLLENLVVDIEHSFKYFSYQITRSRITKFSRVILSGGGANLKNLDRFLNVKLGVPVECFDPFAIFRLPADMESKKSRIAEFPAVFTPAAALSAARKVKDTENFNLLPEGEKSVLGVLKDAMKSKPVKIGVAVLATAILLIGLQAARALYYKAGSGAAKAKFKNSKSEIAKLKIREKELDRKESNLARRRETLIAQSKFIRSAFRAKTDISAAFTETAALLPEEIWAGKLKYENGKFTITGYTVDLAMITEFMENIKKSDIFSGANFNYMEKESGTDVYVFEITTGVRG